MADLRGLLAGEGFEDVRTYLQSGNVVLSSSAKPDEVGRKCEQLIEEAFGPDTAVVTRTRPNLRRSRSGTARDSREASPPPGELPSRRRLAEAVRRLESAVVAPERLSVVGREIYAWHPDGVARSKLWGLLAGRQLGVTATARNWTTVTKLLELAAE